MNFNHRYRWEKCRNKLVSCGRNKGETDANRFPVCDKRAVWYTLHVIRAQLSPVPGPRTRPNVGSADLQRESRKTVIQPRKHFAFSRVEQRALCSGPWWWCFVHVLGDDFRGVLLAAPPMVGGWGGGEVGVCRGVQARGLGVDGTAFRSPSASYESLIFGETLLGEYWGLFFPSRSLMLTLHLS